MGRLAVVVLEPAVELGLWEGRSLTEKRLHVSYALMVALVLTTALVMIFPQIALWLPNTMR